MSRRTDMSKKTQKKPVPQQPRPMRLVYVELEGAVVAVDGKPTASNGPVPIGPDCVVKVAEVKEGFVWLWRAENDIELVPLRRVVAIKATR
jgi:hypothetical protein